MAAGSESSSTPSPAFPGGGGRFSVQAGELHRVLAVQTAEETIWVWIGSHADYDRLTGS